MYIFNDSNVKKLFLLFIPLTALFFFLQVDFAKSQNEHDTTFYVNFPDKLTTRFYTSRKYTSLIFVDQELGRTYILEPNSTLNLGVGATYNDFTLNLAYGFGFMNQNKEQVDTKYLDLQAHIYPKNWVIDLFGQFYRGFFLREISGLENEMELIISFPELRVRKIGANVQYLFNGDKVSLKAAFLQSAMQKKSAGSFLGGFEWYFGNADDPETILPGIVPVERQIQRKNFFQIGPNFGYVHTFVFAKHFFITGMASANLSVGNTKTIFEDREVSNWGVNRNYFLRGFVGYNGPIWSINANYVQNNVNNVRIEGFDSTFRTGNYRINFIYRFELGPKAQPYLEYVDLKRYLPKGLTEKNENKEK